ncbi:MAG: DMT family transporter [Coriobacteriaceae bacterium]|nr:DMT family transporter [Coriobacteriaceae bacterium]
MQRMENRMLPHIAALFTMFVWGLTFVSTKVLLGYLSPIEILFSRTVLGFLTLCLLRPRVLRTKARSHELLFAAAGLTGAFGYYLAENIALQFADASFVSVAVSTAPLFTALLGFVLLKEEGFGLRFVAGFVIAISGIALISFQEGPAHASAIGVLLCLVGALTWAVYSIVIKRLSSFGYDTIAVTKRVFAWGLIYMAVTLVATGDVFPFAALTEPTVMGNLAFLGILASAGCFVTWGYSVKHLGATSASAYIYLQAPVTVVWAVILLGEPFTAAIVAGLALVIVGLALSEGFVFGKRAS